MNCISCGRKIVDSERMCSNCAGKWTKNLVDELGEEKKQASQDPLPQDAPHGFVRSWKPQHQTRKKAVKGSLPDSSPGSDSAPRTW